MADPARQFDDQQDTPGNLDSHPLNRPELDLLPGDGESTPRSKDHMKLADNDSDNLANDEANAGQDSPQSSGQSQELEDLGQHENQVGRGYHPEGTRGHKARGLRSVVLNRRSAAGGGVIATIIAIVFGFSIISGPLQFVHLAQLMQGFHFSANQDQSDDRFVRLSRYIHHKRSGKVENVRLGYFKNKLANRIELKMNKSGIQTSYTEILGFRDGYVVDPKKLASTEFDDLKNKSASEIRSHFEKRFPGIEISSTGDGKLFIDSRNMGYFKQRSLAKVMMQSSGYSKVTSSIGARIMGKRAGITWHPIRKLDNKILTSAEARYLEWKKNRSKSISTGAESALSSKVDPKSDPDATDEDKSQTQGRAGSTSAEAESVIADGNAASDGVNNGDSDSIGKFRERLGTKVRVGLGGASVIGVACLAKGLDDSADKIKQAQVVMPLIRLSMDAVSLGSQVMRGDDVDLEQLGFYNRQLNGKDSSGKNTTWINAASIQSQLGNKGKGQLPDETLKTISQGTPFSFLNDNPYDTILNPLCSTAVTVILTTVSFIGGPITGSVQLIAGEIVNRAVMPDLAKWLAGKAVDPYVAGADYGNYVNYGSHLAANAQAMTAGGRELNDGETTQLAAIQSAVSQEEFSSHSFAYRLFNAYDYRSAAGTLAMNTSPNILQNVSRLASSALNPGKIFASVTSIFSPKASAATGSYDFGVPKYGFSVEEMNDELVKNPYKNAEEVLGSILPAHSDDYIKRAEKCYGVTIDPTSYDITSYDGVTPTYEDFGKENCNDKSASWRQVRFYIFDTQTMTSAACYEGEEDACSEIGFNSSSTSTPVSSPDDGAISGTTQELAKKILADTNISYPYDPYSDNGSTRSVVETLSQGKRAPITCPGIGGTTDVNPGILQFILDLGAQTKVGVNALTDKCHSTGSAHYTGSAVDFECGAVLFDIALADPIADKYGGQRNGETCSKHQHWHYDFPGDF